MKTPLTIASGYIGRSCAAVKKAALPQWQNICVVCLHKTLGEVVSLWAFDSKETSGFSITSVCEIVVILRLGVPRWSCCSWQWQPKRLSLFVVYLMLRGRHFFAVIVPHGAAKQNLCPMCTEVSSQQCLLPMHTLYKLLLCCQCCLHCSSENKRAFVPRLPQYGLKTWILQGL